MGAPHTHAAAPHARVPHAQGATCTPGCVWPRVRAVPQAAAPPATPAPLSAAGGSRNDLGTAQVIPHLSNKLPNEN